LDFLLVGRRRAEGIIGMAGVSPGGFSFIVTLNRLVVSDGGIAGFYILKKYFVGGNLGLGFVGSKVILKYG
jgi:hypothetical protein